MEKSYFVWKGINSLDKNIIVTKLPNFERPQAKIEKIQIPGKDGFLIQDYNAYEGTIKPCECSLDDGYKDDISIWLTGSSEVIFSNEPDKKYKATIINTIPFSKIIPTFHNFIIQFECQPFGYLQGGLNLISLTSAGQLYNPGTYKSKPVITIYGTGDITLTINSKNVILTGVTDYITLNCDIEEAYKELINKNNTMQGEFPVLESGINSISWTGTVTKLEITPNWRNLK